MGEAGDLGPHEGAVGDVVVHEGVGADFRDVVDVGGYEGLGSGLTMPGTGTVSEPGSRYCCA